MSKKKMIRAIALVGCCAVALAMYVSCGDAGGLRRPESDVTSSGGYATPSRVSAEPAPSGSSTSTMHDMASPEPEEASNLRFLENREEELAEREAARPDGFFSFDEDVVEAAEGADETLTQGAGESPSKTDASKQREFAGPELRLRPDTSEEQQRAAGGRSGRNGKAQPESVVESGELPAARPASPEEDILARLGPGEELWIIENSRGDANRPKPRPGEDIPGCGSLVARVREKNVPVPLEHTHVDAKISGYIATVDVTQKFHNPYASKIEAVYVFPLPQNAAVNEFIMTVGDRKIRGIIRERKAAERIYRQARRQGHVASLLTQERPNIFTQKVANIEPGKKIDINIKYFNTLKYTDGSYEFVFPMVVGPRFNPPGSTEGVGAVARGARGASGQSTEVQYLRPEERSGHDISLVAEIDAGVKIEDVQSIAHAVHTERLAPETMRIKLSSFDSIPNKDFVLRYKVAGDRVKSSLLTHRDERGGFFTLMVYPPDELRHVKRQPVEFVFVLDCSGSMSGRPIAKAKQAMERAIKKLQPHDSFQIIRFSSTASQLGAAPLAATPENIERGLAYLRGLNSGGGTMMIEGIKAALDFPHDRERLRFVSFMTDGYIGNEAEIFRAIHRKLGDARIFSFGVGSSVNRHLLEGMARLGRGAVAYIGLDESAGRAVDLFYERVRHPSLTDVEIDWGGLEVTDVYPRHLPDLFVGRPIVVSGRFEGSGKTDLRVQGVVGGAARQIPVSVDLDDESAQHPGIASVWARTRIADLSDQLSRTNDSEIPAEIQDVALDFGLMSAYTAFVAVDASRRTEGDSGTTVQVPLPVPEGVKYETTVTADN